MSAKAKRIITVLILSAFVIVTPTVLSGRAISFKLGDVDLDGTISAADARLVLRASVGLENIEQTPEQATDKQSNKIYVLKNYILQNGTKDKNGNVVIRSTDFSSRPYTFSITYENNGFRFISVSETEQTYRETFNLFIPENTSNQEIKIDFVRVYNPDGYYEWRGNASISSSDYCYGNDVEFSLTSIDNEPTTEETITEESTTEEPTTEPITEPLTDVQSGKDQEVTKPPATTKSANEPNTKTTNPTIEPTKPNTKPTPCNSNVNTSFSISINGWNTLLKNAGLPGGMSDMGFSDFYGMLDN